METVNSNLENISRPDGVEVKLSAKSINLRAILYALILSIIGTCLYVYVWEEFSSYNMGYQIGTIAKQFGSIKTIIYIIAIFLIYILIQTGILYWFGGKDRKAFRWQSDLSGVGFCPTVPIALKYYRISLLLPGILVGVLPTIHGLCVGNATVFYLGMLGVVAASADFQLWNKLRPFDEEDLLLTNNGFFDVTIIKRNYGKKH